MVYIRFSTATRFGNWMFQYAVAKSFARGGVVAFFVDRDCDHRYVEDLKRRSTVLRGLTVVQDLPLTYEDIYNDASLSPENFPKYVEGRNYLLHGVFQRPVLFNWPLVKELYSIPKETACFILENYSDVVGLQKKVSIHVRRGDYLQLPHRHPFVGRSYLRRAVNHFGADHVFVVCSDDIPWCKQFFSAEEFPGRKFVFVEGGTVLSDLYMATFCSHNIMSNSTFSWWGAFLNPNPHKTVVMPSNWFGMEIGRLVSQRAVKDLMFPGVVVVENHYELYDFCKAVALCLRTKAGSVLRRMHLR